MLFSNIQYFVLSRRSSWSTKTIHSFVLDRKMSTVKVLKSHHHKSIHVRNQRNSLKGTLKIHLRYFYFQGLLHITKPNVVTDTLQIINAKIPLQAEKNLGHFRVGIMSLLILQISWNPGQRSTHCRKEKHNFR